MSSTSPLLKLANNGSFEEVEECWMALVEEGDHNLEDFAKAANLLCAAEHSDIATPLLAILLENLNGGEKSENVVDFAHKAVVMGIHDANVRKFATSIQQDAGNSEVAALLQIISDNDNTATRDQVAKCLTLLHAQFVLGSGKVVPEKIKEFNTEDNVFVLTDNEYERRLSVEEAAAELTPLDSDDFRVMLRFESEQLKEQAKDDPATIIRAALRTANGRLEWTKLKKLMARGAVAPNAFSRWWNKSRGLVERDPMIQVYGDKEPTLILRTDPISHEEELAGQLERSASPERTADLVLEYLTSVDQGHEPDLSFLTNCGNTLVALATSSDVDRTTSLFIASVAIDVINRLPETERPTLDIETIMNREEDLSGLVTSLPHEEASKRALLFLREHGPDHWVDVFTESLPNAPGRLPDMIAQELIKEGHADRITPVIRSILATPFRHGEGVLWLWKAVASGTAKDFPQSVDPGVITLSLLRLMDHWSRNARSQVSDGQRVLLGRMRTSLSSSDFRAVTNLLGKVTEGQAIALHAATTDNQGLNETARQHIILPLMNKHSDAILGKKELWEEDVIYVTAEGLRKREEEYDRIINDEMVKNSEDIGKAADFGDLSENAEFTAALEKRDFLSHRANEIGEEINQALIIPMDRIDETHVNVGTRITVRDAEKGKEESYTFLGPWDTDIDQGIYSYQAPFSKSFMGKKVGAVVTTSGESGEQSLEIIAIEKIDVTETIQ